MTTPEDAVRRYLNYLVDPSSAVDPESVKAAEVQLAAAADPIEKIRAHAALEKARSGDAGSLQLLFINNARTWAQTEGIPFKSFREVGVPIDVLEAAGLTEGKNRGKTTGGKVRKRAPKVSIQDIVDWMVKQNKPFTTADIQSGVGGSPATVKKAIDQLLAAKKLRNLGVNAEHQNRGRAPFMYTTSFESPTRGGSKASTETKTVRTRTKGEPIAASA